MLLLQVNIVLGIEVSHLLVIDSNNSSYNITDGFGNSYTFNRNATISAITVDFPFDIQINQTGKNGNVEVHCSDFQIPSIACFGSNISLSCPDVNVDAPTLACPEQKVDNAPLNNCLASIDKRLNPISDDSDNTMWIIIAILAAVGAYFYFTNKDKGNPKTQMQKQGPPPNIPPPETMFPQDPNTYRKALPKQDYQTTKRNLKSFSVQEENEFKKRERTQADLAKEDEERRRQEVNDTIDRAVDKVNTSERTKLEKEREAIRTKINELKTEEAKEVQADRSEAVEKKEQKFHEILNKKLEEKYGKKK